MQDNSSSVYFDWPYRESFFIFNITIGVLFVILHARMIMVILRSRTLRKLAGYHFMVHVSVVDLINCICQILAQICTLKTPDMHPIINEINGALFQGTWAADYPMILIVAVNRVVAVLLPFKVKDYFGEQLTKVYISVCIMFGFINTATCLSGEVNCVWIAQIPSFAFTKTSVTADILNFVDFWFAEFVILCSTACYIVIFIYLMKKRRLIASSRHELPLLFHSCCIFGVTGISLYLWHRPASDSIIYHQLLQTAIVIRFGMPPVAALLVNKTVRSRFFRFKDGNRRSMTISTTGPRETAAAIRKSKGKFSITALASATLFPNRNATRI